MLNPENPLTDKSIPDNGDLRSLLASRTNQANPLLPQRGEIEDSQDSRKAGTEKGISFPFKQKEDSPKTPILTCNSSFYHQIPGEQPIAIPNNWWCELKSEEQPYHRPGLTVTSDWTLVYYGWLDPSDVGIVFLQNTNARATVLLGYAANPEGEIIPFAKLSSGDPQQNRMRGYFFEPYRPELLYLRCEGAEKCKINLVAFPA